MVYHIIILENPIALITECRGEGFSCGRSICVCCEGIVIDQNHTDINFNTVDICSFDSTRSL